MESGLRQALYLMAVGVAALVPGVLFLYWFRWRRYGGPAEICNDNLRGPGDTLREKIGRLDDKFAELLVLFFLLPAVMFSFVAGATLAPGFASIRNDFPQLCLATAVVLVIPILYAGRKLKERVGLLHDLDAELAVGRELNRLAWKGFHVFNDFQDAGNNIDHVLVGSTGVYVVETKGKPRPDKDRVGMDAKVIYDGEALYFPDNAKETDAIEQARKKAESLSQWLGEELDEPVRVQATLALPGWFVERRKQDDLLILYGLSSHYARLLKGPEVLSYSIIGKIVERLEERNRGLDKRRPKQGVAHNHDMTGDQSRCRYSATFNGG